MDEISLRRKKKKIIIVCFAIFAAVASISCAFFIFDRFVYQEKIAFNGAVYTQKGENITELPAGSTESGYIRSISHMSASNPNGDFTSVNLDEKYAGCMIYQSEDGKVIYLYDYSGFYIPFVFTKYVAQAKNE